MSNTGKTARKEESLFPTNFRPVALICGPEQSVYIVCLVGLGEEYQELFLSNLSHPVPSPVSGSIISGYSGPIITFPVLLSHLRLSHGSTFCWGSYSMFPISIFLPSLHYRIRLSGMSSLLTVSLTVLASQKGAGHFSSCWKRLAALVAFACSCHRRTTL